MAFRKNQKEDEHGLSEGYDYSEDDDEELTGIEEDDELDDPAPFYLNGGETEEKPPKEKKFSLFKKKEKPEPEPAEDAEPAFEPVPAVAQEEEKPEKKSKKKKKEKKPDNIEKLPTELPFMIRLVIRLAVLLVIVVAGLIFLNTKCKIKEIKVVGSTWYTDEEIIKMLQNGKYDKYSLFFKAHYTFEEFPGIAFVEKISLKLDSLDTVTIKVYEKNIVGCIHIMDDYFYFDKDGIIVASRILRQKDIPMVDGLDFMSATINSKLAVSDDAVFDSILQITQLIDKHKVDVDRIFFDPDLAVTLYANDGNVIYLGKQARYDEMIAALPEILAAAREKGGKYKLDMSSFSGSNTTIRAEFIEKPEKNEISS